MPVYDGEKFLDEAIQSILNQTLRDFEFLILNDGSNDSSLDIIKKYSKTDKRIKVIDQTNIGLTKSLNKCLEICEGKFIARQDADDKCDPTRFEKQIKYLMEENYEFCCTRTFVEEKKIISPRYLYYLPYKITLLFQNPFIHGSWMFSKNILKKIGFYDESIKYAQDYDYISRVIYSNIKVKYLKDYLYYTGENSNKISVAKKQKQRFFAKKIRLKNKYRLFKFM